VVKRKWKLEKGEELNGVTFAFFSISLFKRCKIESSFDEMQNLQVTNQKKMKMLQCSSNAALQTMQVLQ
jgi:hypothetical protein